MHNYNKHYFSKVWVIALTLCLSTTSTTFLSNDVKLSATTSVFEESFDYSKSIDRFAKIYDAYPELRDGSVYGCYGVSNIPIFSYNYSNLSDSYMEKVQIKEPNIEYVAPVLYSNNVKSAYEKAGTVALKLNSAKNDLDRMSYINQIMDYICDAENSSTASDEELAGDLDQKDYLVAMVMYNINLLSPSNQEKIVDSIINKWFNAIDSVLCDKGTAKNGYSRLGITRNSFAYFCQYYANKLDNKEYAYVSDYIIALPDGYISDGDTFNGHTKTTVDKIISDKKQSIKDAEEIVEKEENSDDTIYSETTDDITKEFWKDFNKDNKNDGSYEVKYKIKDNACYAEMIYTDTDGNTSIEDSLKLKASLNHLCTGEKVGEDVAFNDSGSHSDLKQDDTVKDETANGNNKLMTDEDVDKAMKDMSYYFISYVIDNEVYNTEIPSNSSREISVDNAFLLLDAIAKQLGLTVYDDGDKKLMIMNGITVCFNSDYDYLTTDTLDYLANGAFNVIVSTPTPTTYKDTIIENLTEFDKVLINGSEVSLTYSITYKDKRAYIYDRDMLKILNESIGFTDNYYLFRKSNSSDIIYIDKAKNVIVSDTGNYRINDLYIKDSKVDSIDIVSLARILGYNVSVDEHNVLSIEKN